ncbi:MAG: hypothetical protein IPK93_12910 [Solirubrobacterales bacterium]|nr:hypothetical protein [Solirubrobacterales bacterium]
MTARIGASELSFVLLLLCVVIVPIAAIAFARSGRALDELGKGTFAIDREKPGRGEPANSETARAEQEAEVRQMVEASAFRRRARGEPDIDVQSEIDRVLGVGPWAEIDASEVSGEDGPEGPAGLEGGTAQIRAEIRELVIANNERRLRRGEDPLDVDSEVERRFREWT